MMQRMQQNLGHHIVAREHQQSLPQIEQQNFQSIKKKSDLPEIHTNQSMSQ